MNVFHFQIQFQCFAFLKEQLLNAGLKILNILFPLSPHLYLQVLQDKRYAVTNNFLECLRKQTKVEFLGWDFKASKLILQLQQDNMLRVTKNTRQTCCCLRILKLNNSLINCYVFHVHWLTFLLQCA